jgi:predicted DNA repair protein MutK
MIALSTVLEQSLLIQIVVASIVAIVATFWVYGIVALIVRLDDIWFYFVNKKSQLSKKFWNFLVASLPIIIKILAVVWTWAMLLVAGGIFTHNISIIHHFYETINYIPSIIFDTILWFIAGYILVIIFFLWKKMFKKKI